MNVPYDESISPGFLNMAGISMSLPTVNHELLHAYLSVDPAEEVARLAALMAPAQEKFDAKRLISAAVEIRREAQDQAVLDRRRILRQMSPQTLLQLCRELELEHLSSGLNDTNWKMIHDPVVGPVLERLMEHPDEAFPTVNIFSDPQNIECALYEALEEANRRTTRRLPVLPCTMEEAVRYAADESTVSWADLEAAFREFLIASPLGWKSKNDEKEEFMYQRSLINNSLYLAGLPIDTPGRAIVVFENETLSFAMKELIDQKQFRATWKPGYPLPDVLLQELDEVYDYFWPDPQCLGELSVLKVLTFDFHQFWMRHRNTYDGFTIAKTKAEEARTRAEKNRAAAPAKSVRRDKELWKQRTTDFIRSQSFRDLQKTKETDRTQETFENAAKEHIQTLSDQCILTSKLRDKRTRPKVQKFLGSLFFGVASKANTDLESFCKKMRSSGIKTLDAETVRECHLLLESALEGREIKATKERKRPKRA